MQKRTACWTIHLKNTNKPRNKIIGSEQHHVDELRVSKIAKSDSIYPLV